MQAYLYVFNSLADWEIGFITAELNSGRYFRARGEKISVVAIANERKPVTTMGGLRIVPECTVADVEFRPNDILILPGGDTWLDPVHAPLLDMIPGLLNRNIIVAAICGATAALAGKGVLDTRKHTSNDLNYLRGVCPAYAGSSLYLNEPAVTDGNLITAPGTSPLEFAYHILKKIAVFSTGTLEAWYNFFKYKEGKYFHALMKSLE